VKIEYDGQSYDYDAEDLSVKQAAKIERHIWRGTVDAVKAGVLIQLQLLQQANPALDLAAVRQAVDELATAAEAGGAGTLLDWEMGLLRGRSDCVQALAWLVLHDGKMVPIADVEVKVVKMARAFQEAQTAERAAARDDETDPTGLPAVPLSPPPDATPETSGNGVTTSRGRSRKA
jgi:hypothetical protein